MGIWGMRRCEVHATIAQSVGGIDVGSCRKSASYWGEKWLKGISSRNFRKWRFCRTA